MEDIASLKTAVQENGFAIVPALYTPEEVTGIIGTIEQADRVKETFRRSADLFAIRQFLKEVPATQALLFNSRLQSLIRRLCGDDYFVVKSIYFDKPGASNWYGALKVIPGSHRNQICRPGTIDVAEEKEVTCNVPGGGAMIMKPLLLHSSGRTLNGHPRRVVHMEFSNRELPAGLHWAEKLALPG